MTDNFYRAFEEKFRGPRELIRKRLTSYKPFLGPLLSVYPEARAVDLGCGRGEWLEYVNHLGFSAQGVDLDEGMLAACVDLGLRAEKDDLLNFLRSVDDESLTLVSAFHVVEHISFENLRALIAEVMRVLKPGGLLILETPNPENIVVATNSFYLDPTHQKPIPPQLLAFTAYFTGFARVKTLRLQEEKGLVDKVSININDLLKGVSPDYAIVAQKHAKTEINSKFDEAFSQQYGLSLDALAARFDERLSKIEVQANEAEAKAHEALTNLHAVLNSRSWRLTAPLRVGGKKLKTLRHYFKKKQLKLALRHFALYVQKRPRLKRAVLSIINQFPLLKRRLLFITRNESNSEKGNGLKVPLELENLTPRARQIYQDINEAIGHRRERK